VALVSASSILAVAHDPGGANAVAATVRVLRERGRRVRALMRGPALSQLARLGVECEPAPSTDVPVEGASLVLVGTSAGDWLERSAIARARAAGVPSLALIDYWVHYRARFTHPAAPQGELAYLPDWLAAIDGACRDGMLAEGLPAERIRVLGQPYFGWLVARRATARAPSDAHGRFLFASEPGERAVLALERLALALPAGARLLVRRHPREPRRDELLTALAGRGVATEIDTTPDPLATARACDAVLGLSSTLLIETTLAGVPTATLAPELQPRLIELGLAVPLATDTELARFLAAPALGQISEHFLATQRGADERCADACEAMARR
jgi:hypothetical protein